MRSTARKPGSTGARRPRPGLRSFAALGLALYLQAGVSRAAFEDAAVGARQFSLGTAATALQDANGSLLNPALAGSARKFETGAHFEAGTRGNGEPLDFNSYVLNAFIPGMVHGRFGAMSIAGRYRSFEDLELSEKSLSLGWGTWQLIKTVSGSVDLGSNLKFMQLASDRTSDSKMAAALDLGAIWRVGSRRSFGLSLLNLNSPSFNEGALEGKAPFTVRLGAAEQTEDYTLTVDALRRYVSDGAGKYGFNFGVEYLWRTERSGAFTSRAGMSMIERASTFSLGIGHRHLAADISYALLLPLTGKMRAGHAVSLSMRFGDRDLDSEYETLIKREIKYRKDLVQALDESSKREGVLRDELASLKDEIEKLDDELRSAKEQKDRASEAKGRLEAIVARQRRAEEELKSMEENRRRDRLRRLDLDFGRDWQAYLKMKAGGAPRSVLKGSLQRLVGEYQGTGIDISQATLELRRLVSEE